MITHSKHNRACQTPTESAYTFTHIMICFTRTLADLGITDIAGNTNQIRPKTRLRNSLACDIHCNTGIVMGVWSRRIDAKRRYMRIAHMNDQCLVVVIPREWWCHVMPQSLFAAV